MSSCRSTPSKGFSAKCHHFCCEFDCHNYCPTCKEAGKDDDSCVTGLFPCTICQSFSDESRLKIINRKQYHSKRNVDKVDTSREESEVLGKSEAPMFSGTQAGLENSADKGLYQSCLETLKYIALFT